MPLPRPTSDMRSVEKFATKPKIAVPFPKNRFCIESEAVAQRQAKTEFPSCCEEGRSKRVFLCNYSQSGISYLCIRTLTAWCWDPFSEQSERGR